jgi:hypothetical protein
MKKIIALIVLIMTLNSCAEKIVINREVDSTEYGKMLLGTQSFDQFQKNLIKFGLMKIIKFILQINHLLKP